MVDILLLQMYVKRLLTNGQNKSNLVSEGLKQIGHSHFQAINGIPGTYIVYTIHVPANGDSPRMGNKMGRPWLGGLSSSPAHPEDGGQTRGREELISVRFHAYVKEAVSRDFLYPVFFIKQFILILFEMS